MKVQEEKPVLSFYRYSKQWYYDKSRPDEIVVGNYYWKDGGCDWEFVIREYPDLGPGATRVEMYDDAVQSLDNPLLVSALISILRAKTLDAVSERLLAAGLPERVIKQEGHHD